LPPTGRECIFFMWGRKLMARIDGERLARIVVRVAESASLDKFHDFYTDGQWVVQVCRKLREIFGGLEDGLDEGSGMEGYIMSKPKIDEELGYLGQADVEGMSCSAANQAMKMYVSRMDKAYGAWSAAGKDEPEKLSAAQAEYASAVSEAIKYIDAFEASCVNIIRNHFVRDEEEVSSVLEEIRDSGNYVMNGK